LSCSGNCFKIPSIIAIPVIIIVIIVIIVIPKTTIPLQTMPLTLTLPLTPIGM